MPPIERGITHILDHPSRVVPVFQPIIRLDNHEVIGFEALARWPESPGVNPVDAFDVARTRGELARLDWWCRKRAVDTVREAGVGADRYLFINVEPDSLSTPPPWHGDRLLADIADAGVQIVLELTERTLVDDPPTVSRTVDHARRRGFGIALDDVGARPECLALLDVIAPDVVKLDRSLTQLSDQGIESAVAITAAGDYARRHGATVLAEGIETAAHETCAARLGATLGQGFRFGRPGPLVDTPPTTAVRPELVDPDRGAVASLDAILDGLPTTVGTVDEVLHMCEVVETTAVDQYTPGCVVGVLAGPRHGCADLAARYRAMTERHLLVGLSGPGLGRAPQPGVRGPRTPDMPCDRAFGVAAIAADTAVAVVARAIGSHDGPDAEFRWSVTTDRAAVARIARSIIVELAPN